MAMCRRIRDLRDDRDLTQKQAGEAIDVSQRPYAYYEMLTPQVFCALAEFHNTSVDYLLERTDDPRPYPRKR